MRYTERHLTDLIENLAAERNIDENDVVSALKTGLKKAWKDIYGNHYDFEVDYKKGELTVYKVSRSDNEEKKDPVSLEDLPRKSISNILETLSEEIEKAVKEKSYEMFKGRVGELISCKFKKKTAEGIVLRTEGYDGIIPNNLKVYRENFFPDEEMKCRLHEVIKDSLDYQLIFDRRTEEFLKEVIKEAVPEAKSGIIEIKGVARNAGSSSKVFVYSNDPRVPPIKSCVSSSRMNEIKKELRGENVSFVLWSDKLSQQIENAFYGIGLIKIIIDEDENEVKVIVKNEDTAKSLGRNGQNAALISKLVGKKIIIVSKDEYDLELEEEKKKKIQHLIDNGFTNEESSTIFRYYNNLDEILKFKVNMPNELYKKAKNFLLEEYEDEREDFIKAGGSNNLFLYKEQPIDVYFSLLNAGIHSLEELKEYDPLTLERHTGIDLPTCILLLS